MQIAAISLCLLATAALCSCQVALNITADYDVKVIPRDENNGAIHCLTLLICVVKPDLNVSMFETQWLHPSGVPVNPITAQNSAKYITTEGRVRPGNIGTVLVIMLLSYSDAGNYTCQARRESTDPWVSDVIQLQTTFSLQTEASTVSVLDNATEVELTCEMREFLRPDGAFQWFKDGELIDTASARYSLTFRDSEAENTSQSGLRVLVPGRVSTLSILGPRQSDSGNYTCVVETTGVDIRLQVEGGGSTDQPVTTPTTAAANTTDGTVSPTEFPLPVVIGVVAAFLGIVVLILIAIIIVVSLKRQRRKAIILLSDFDDNNAYASTNANGQGASRASSVAKYSQVDKSSLSPPPPLPARPSPSINMSMATSINSLDHHALGYDAGSGDMKGKYEESMKYDPYYDRPEDVQPSRIIPPSTRKTPKGYYDEVEISQELLKDAKFAAPAGAYDMTSVPSPATVLNGSLHRQLNPDFAYPNFNNTIVTDPEAFTTDTHTDADYDQIYSEPIDPSMLNHEYETEMSSGEAIPYSAIYEDPQPLMNIEAPLMVEQENIIEVKKLGTGQFGHVILAKTKGLSMKDMRLSEDDTDRNKSILVAIKKLKPDAESGLMEAFDKEVKFMARLNHDNVVRLIGVCNDEESFIMMEYMENGDLNQFLQKQRLMPDTISGLQETEITPIILLYLGVQIASGMHYLASHKFVHRDLATRNCLVGKDFIVKISDFGMSRSLYESAYYRVQGTLVLPIRWMACETFYGKFSVKSDAWAFGVTLWELYTLGKIDPYDTMTDEEVIADAIRGPDRKILERTEDCPPDVYEIMLRCWVHEPSMRADFGEIYSRLFMIYTRQAL